MASPVVTIVPSTAEHVRLLAPKLRLDDRREIEIYGFSANKALWRSFKGTILRKTAFVDGEIAAMWGVSGVPMSGVGQPFLLTSDAVHNISPLTFAKIYQQEVYQMLTIFPKLVNFVDASYTAAIRLLDIIGFTLSDPEPLGEHGALFMKFEMGS